MLENKWYALYTKPRWEKKVSETLTQRGVENYCPLNRVKKQWADRKKVILEPLFKSYVFVRSAESGHLQLKKTEGVIDLLHWLGKPAAIRDGEIEMIQRFLNEHVNVSLEKIKVNINDRVRVINGPLMEFEGRVIAVTNKTAKVVLPSLGFIMTAEIETANMEIIQSDIVKGPDKYQVPR
jgi:transcription antitermination factor NusG